MHFGDKVFRTIIPRNIRLAEAAVVCKPVLFTTGVAGLRSPTWHSLAR